MRIKLANVRKVHKLVPSRKQHSVNAEYCVVIIIIILATENRRFNQYIRLSLGRATDEP